MKTNMKPLGLAVAVAAVSAGYAGGAAAQAKPASNLLGDLAIVPYYTVQDDWVTGVHITNTSALTQVVKLRLRRATDSADALDFNLILSPFDVWTGFLDDSSGKVVFATDDASCTAPLRADGKFEMPPLYAAGAEEGYIEVIGMGSAAASMPIAAAALHKDGVPADCSAVASNFFQNTKLTTTGAISVDTSKKGVISNGRTHQTVAAADFKAANATYTCVGTEAKGGVCQTAYEQAGNVLKVSYFFRDAASGIEFGGDAIHLEGFGNLPMMTNQEFGLFSGDVLGFDYPDLDGGPLIQDLAPGLSLAAPIVNPVDRGKYVSVVRENLGVDDVLNDWSTASARNVSTDWVVTIPGQYTMVDLFVALTTLGIQGCGALDDPTTAVSEATPTCDYRDIPVGADLFFYDREEGVIVPEDGDLVISPAPPGTTNTLELPNEVNVIEWTDGTNTPVLGAANPTTVDTTPIGADNGWATLAVSSNALKTQRICQFAGPAGAPGETTVYSDTTKSWTIAANGTKVVRDNCTELATLATTAASARVPMAGFVAWERSFPQNPDGNYGRLIQHSFVKSN